MSLVIPPGFGSAALIFSGAVGTAPYVTTIGVDLSNYGGDFVLAANQVKAVYATTIGAETSENLSLDRVTLAIGADGPGGSVDSDTVPDEFTRSGAFPPTAMSAIARKVTNELGRRGRGRMFLPGVVSEGEVDQDGTIQSARITALTQVVQDFVVTLGVGDMVGPAMPTVLLHSSAPLDPTPLTNVTISSKVGWIRGRIR
uniref:Uncharacterized protein n=1 Tax=uncultured prokaryote TaxID=198431 RepID=A0A0H5Q3M9_9ZZZZ|nr:hypothetical protein [uncultured prokaryote]